MKVVVVALGKIGLPLAVHAARHGHDVIGVDIAQTVVDQVNTAQEPFPGETGLAEGLAEVVPGRLRATTDAVEALADGVDLVLAVPPLMVDDRANPDWRALDAALDAIGRGLAAAHAAHGTAAGDDGTPPSVVVETTLPVGSTRGRVTTRLEAASGLREGVDFHAAHSPERVYSGRIFADLENYPKLVGGLDETGEERTAERYVRLLSTGETPVEVRAMGGAEAAELTKLAETTYRDINIAFANELARHADAIGVDVDAVIDAANSQPFSHIHRAGVAVGGHCIPVYPRFYLAGDPGATLPAAARTVNEAMPAYAVELLADTLAAQPGATRDLTARRVLVLGATYRGDVKETAFSGVFGLRDALHAAGAIPLVADPLMSDDELTALGLQPWDGQPVDAAIVQADHARYRDLQPADVPGATVIVDGRNVLEPAAWAARGVTVRRIGRDAERPGVTANA